jgi:hypothetical protein
VMDATTPEEKPERRRFASLPSDLRRLSIWLREQGVEEAVMESTAQYWRSVWLELEPYMGLHLAQAFSNRAPRGRKHDFKDAERLVRRLIAKELILSFVPDGEHRTWRNMARMKLPLTRDRVRLENQMECLLEEMRIKLSIVVSNLLDASGLRILRALAQGETDPKQLAQLGDERLQCTEEQLVDAWTGRAQPMHREMLALRLERLQLIDLQIAKLNGLIARAMKPHQDAVIRLAEVPGLGVGFGQPDPIAGDCSTGTYSKGDTQFDATLPILPHGETILIALQPSGRAVSSSIGVPFRMLQATSTLAFLVMPGECSVHATVKWGQSSL